MVYNNHVIEGMAPTRRNKMDTIKVGDTVELHGHMVNWYEKVWTFKVAEIDYDCFDETVDSGPYMVFTSGHIFSGDQLHTGKRQQRGHMFTDVKLIKKGATK
tara:strand:- start:207 stop:512 length:306 start_codon:yes stop_codon:yes gene_type:complete